MNQFKILDRIFWLIWLAFPIAMALTYQSVFGASPLLDHIPENCRPDIPTISNFSTVGKVEVAFYFFLQFAFYAVVFLLAHRSIRRCMNGSVLVEDILKTLGIIGTVVLAMSFILLLANNALNYALVLSGDVKTFVPEYAFDIGPPAFGILVLAMREVIAHAIKLKQDHDLTI